jgi:hypothetical protein
MTATIHPAAMMGDARSLMRKKAPFGDRLNPKAAGFQRLGFSFHGLLLRN